MVLGNRIKKNCRFFLYLENEIRFASTIDKGLTEEGVIVVLGVHHVKSDFAYEHAI